MSTMLPSSFVDSNFRTKSEYELSLKLDDEKRAAAEAEAAAKALGRLCEQPPAATPTASKRTPSSGASRARTATGPRAAARAARRSTGEEERGDPHRAASPREVGQRGAWVSALPPRCAGASTRLIEPKALRGAAVKTCFAQS